MASEEEMLREFELIQGIVERQAENSFRIKGWTVTLVVVAIVFRTDDFQLFGAFIPLLGFWGLDAYFLRQEKIYRRLYDWVRKNRPNNDSRQFDLNASRFDDQVDRVPLTMLSPTLIAFYGTITVLLAVYSVIVFTTNGGQILG